MRYERESHGAGQAGGPGRGSAARRLAHVLLLGLALGLWGHSASAQQQMEFDSDSTAANGVWQNGTVTLPQTVVPEMEWGEPVWIRVLNVFDPAGQPPVFRFWRANTETRDQANQIIAPPYGFAVLPRRSTPQSPADNQNPSLGFWIDQRVVPGTPPVVYQGVMQTLRQLATYTGNPAPLSNSPLYLNPEQQPPFEVGMAPVGAIGEPGVVFAPGIWRLRVEQVDNGGQRIAFPPPASNPNYVEFVVRNPLAIMQADPAGGAQIADPGRLWDYEATGSGAPNVAPQGNGSPFFATRGNDRMLERVPQNGPRTIPTFGSVDHDRASNYGFYVADRSRWGADPDGIHDFPVTELTRTTNPLRVRVLAGDLNPNPALGPNGATTNRVDALNNLILYGEPNYPAMAPSCLRFSTAAGEDLVADGAPLTVPKLGPEIPGAPDTHTAAKTQYGYRPIQVTLKVPRYQPDTYYQTGALVAIDNIPPSERIRVWVDSNGDGLLNLRDPLNPAAAAVPGQPAGYEEAYRDFDVSVYVPPDFRFTVVETTVDLGKHPHNEAMPSGQPTLDSARSFTVRNDGNVNLINLRVAHDYLIEGAALRTPVSLYCPDTDYDATSASPAPAGLRIPPSDLLSGRTHVWWSFDPGTQNPPVLPLWGTRGYLSKAQVGAGAPTTTTAEPVAGVLGGPRVGVVSPFGTPAGTYASRYFVYEDRSPANLTLDYRQVGPGAFQALEPIAQDAFTLKITVTDRQLTEEASAFGIDRPVPGFVDTTTNPPSNYVTENFPRAGDSQPAVTRFWSDNTSRQMALFWTSNRNAWDGTQVLKPLPSWYLYHTRTSEVPTSQTWPFWGQNPDTTRTLQSGVPNPPTPLLAQTLFPTMANPNTTEKEERYVSPSVAVTQSSLQEQWPAYLFFQATAHARETGNPPNGAATQRAYGLYYVPLDAQRLPAANPVPVGRESVGIVRHGVKGLSYRQIDASMQNSGAHYLFAFWHGGPENAWQGYYSWWRAGQADWNREERLPIYGDFTCVQDITPVYSGGYHTYFNPRPPQWRHEARDLIDIYFSGFSKFRRSGDIYLARIDPNSLTRGSWGAFRAKQPFAPVRAEVLSNTNDRVFTAQHLEWLTYPYAYPVTNEPVFPRIWLRTAPAAQPIALTPDPATVAQNPALANDATRWWTYNQADSSYTWKFTGYQSAGNPDLNGQNTITLYPMAGVVVFSKPMDAGEILADYIPQILRVAASPQLETSPCAFVDTRVGPAQSPIPRRRPMPPVDTGLWEFPRTYLFPDNRPIPRDRIWAFWTRVAPQVSNPTVWAKTMRLMVQLPDAIQAGANQPVTVTDEFGRAITQFTVDPAAGKLYFPTYQATGGMGFGLEGRKVTVSYTAPVPGQAAGRPGGAPIDPYIRWRDEQPEAPLPIDAIANEGKVFAFPDLAPAATPAILTDPVQLTNYLNDMGTWRVWVFWASSRPKVTWNVGNPLDPMTHQPLRLSGDTDLRYMTLSPRLDFRPALPAP